MISPDQCAQLRRLFYAEHWRVHTIAAQLGVPHDTVRRAIESDRFIRPGAQIRPSLLDPYKAVILATLEQYPRLRATRLWAMVRGRGYPGSVIQVQRYVRTVRPAARAEAYLRLDPLVGEQGQVDWGHFGTVRVGSTTRSPARPRVPPPRRRGHAQAAAAGLGELNEPVAIPALPHVAQHPSPSSSPTPKFQAAGAPGAA